MADRVHRQVRRGDLRVAHVPEKIETRDRNACTGDGSGTPPPGPGATVARGEANSVIKKNFVSSARKSSGNVFADLGLPHPEQELLKAKLTLQIYQLIKASGLTQAEAGKILGIKQPHVSALMRNRSGSFSVERLIQFLTALGQDVEITVRPTRKEHGQVSLVV